MSRVVVTGGTGFIGGRVVEELLARRDYKVWFTGRRPPADRALLDKGAQFLAGDLANAEFARQVAERADIVIHCAGKAGTWGSYGEYQLANVQATRNLLEASKRSGVQRIVNLSSPSIYFDYKDQLKLKENERPRRFADAYAETKFLAEQLMREYHGAGLRTVSLRPRSVIGRGDQNVLPRLLRLAESGALVQIGEGHNVVDITTVGNLVDAIFLCINARDEAMGEVYNISNGAPVRFWDFVSQVLRAAGLPEKRKKLPYTPVMAVAKANEFLCRRLGVRREPTVLPLAVGVISFSMTMDISKAQRLLGYAPRLSTHDGIAEFFGKRVNA